MKSEEINHLSWWQICLSPGREMSHHERAGPEFPSGYDQIDFMPQNNYRNLKMEMMYAGHTSKLLFPNDILSMYINTNGNAHTFVNCVYPWNRYRAMKTITQCFPWADIVMICDDRYKQKNGQAQTRGMGCFVPQIFLQKAGNWPIFK